MALGFPAVKWKVIARSFALIYTAASMEKDAGSHHQTAGAKGGRATKRKKGKAWFKKLAEKKWRKYRKMTPEQKREYGGGRPAKATE
jgi:hypothetical protein